MDSHGKLFKSNLKKHHVKIVRGHKQYQYSSDNRGYLDFECHSAHVGHNHTLVVTAAQQQLKKLSTGHSVICDVARKFDKAITSVLPASLRCYYMINSGSEANDLAMVMARKKTGGEHFIVFKGSYHGSFTGLLEISPKTWNMLGWPAPSHTHLVNPPDIYNGPYRDLPDACDRYIQEVASIINDVQARGGKIAGFISEPISTACGVIVPPKLYYKKVYELIRRAGGIVIADETGCNLGRAGEHLWTFEHFEVVPDVVTVGKSLGNGYPVALLCTTKDIANKLGEHVSTFGGNPVACAVSCAVLDVIDGEMVRASTRCVGKYLMEELRGLQQTHSILGDVRGKGLCVGVEIVTDTRSRCPHPALASHISSRLLDNGFITAVGGSNDNVLVLTPPLCITRCNVSQFVSALKEVLLDTQDFPSFKREPMLESEQEEEASNQRKKCKFTSS